MFRTDDLRARQSIWIWLLKKVVLSRIMLATVSAAAAGDDEENKYFWVVTFDLCFFRHHYVKLYLLKKSSPRCSFLNSFLASSDLNIVL